MATNELEVQPVQDRNTEEMELQTEDLIPEQEQAPTEKSGVRIDPKALNQTARFNKYDAVHMSIIEHGIRKKGNFKVGKGRPHPSGSYWEYQLVDADGKLYKNGTWIREKELRMEKKHG